MAGEGGGALGVAVPVAGVVRGIVQAIRGVDQHKGRQARAAIQRQVLGASTAATAVARAANVAAAAAFPRSFPSPLGTPGGVLWATPPQAAPAGNTPPPPVPWYQQAWNVLTSTDWIRAAQVGLYTGELLRELGIFGRQKATSGAGIGISIGQAQPPPQFNTLTAADVGGADLTLGQQLAQTDAYTAANFNQIAEVPGVANVWTGILQGAGEALASALSGQGTSGTFGPGFGIGGGGIMGTGIVAQPGGALVTTGGVSGAPVMGGVRAARSPSIFAAVDPMGRQVLVRSLGRPIAWSGDVSAVRRLKRAAKRIHRALPGSSGRSRYRRRRGGY